MSKQLNAISPHSHIGFEPRTTINVRASTHKRLSKYITYGKSFDSVISELIDFREDSKK